ncbi:MAG: peptide chain release factor 2 [SAR202 cluster bacterium]|nr:peptide chain release factor 2 [SAR202 cluster bacterium]
MLQIEKEISTEGFWDNSFVAQKKMKELSILKNQLDPWVKFRRDLENLIDICDLVENEFDETLAKDIVVELDSMDNDINTEEFKVSLSGSYDYRSAIFSIHSGAGGLEAEDWAQMLFRMYTKWSDQKKFNFTVLSASVGEEGGLKSIVVEVKGDYAFGYLKSEKGVHRLVRISPFDSDHARHTSFALVEVLPEVEDDLEISIDPSDLKIDVFKAGGAGGQSVQKNSTAVRITHVPTGIKVSCQNERSQYQNKTIAMKILSSRLLQQNINDKAQEINKLKGEHISAEWGNQIRSYVLHPYTMVKDHRTGLNVSNAEAVLNGDIQGFIDEYLRKNIPVE